MSKKATTRRGSKSTKPHEGTGPPAVQLSLRVRRRAVVPDQVASATSDNPPETIPPASPAPGQLPLDLPQ